MGIKVTHTKLQIWKSRTHLVDAMQAFDMVHKNESATQVDV